MTMLSKELKISRKKPSSKVYTMHAMRLEQLFLSVKMDSGDIFFLLNMK